MSYWNNEHYADPTAYAGMRTPRVMPLQDIRRGTYGYIEFRKTGSIEKVECLACGRIGFCFIVEGTTRTYTPTIDAYDKATEEGWRLWIHDPTRTKVRTPWGLSTTHGQQDSNEITR